MNGFVISSRVIKITLVGFYTNTYQCVLSVHVIRINKSLGYIWTVLSISHPLITMLARALKKMDLQV